MIKVKKEGIILNKTNLNFEKRGVLNPACVQIDNTIHMYYRAIDEEYRSTIGYCQLSGPLNVAKRNKKPLIVPEYSYEKQGVEDPRIVYFNKIYYMFYAAYDGKNALGAYATSKDLINFKKGGIITPLITYDLAEDYFRESKESLKEKYFFFESYFKDIVGKDVLLWEKDHFIFPKKFNGKFALIHRILPDIQIIFFKNFKELASNEYWIQHLKRLSKYVVLEPKHWFETRNIGGGCPPIKTKHGWLLIYHSVQDSNAGKIYRACAALLDINNPLKLIGRLSYPLFSPEMDWETKGIINNVVFPTATAQFDDTLYIYYGAADQCIAVASLNINELLAELLHGK